jgi:hypothetical protein
MRLFNTKRSFNVKYNKKKQNDIVVIGYFHGQSVTKNTKYSENFSLYLTL